MQLARKTIIRETPLFGCLPHPIKTNLHQRTCFSHFFVAKLVPPPPSCFVLLTIRIYQWNLRCLVDQNKVERVGEWGRKCNQRKPPHITDSKTPQTTASSSSAIPISVRVLPIRVRDAHCCQCAQDRLSWVWNVTLSTSDICDAWLTVWQQTGVISDVGHALNVRIWLADYTGMWQLRLHYSYVLLRTRTWPL